MKIISHKSLRLLASSNIKDIFNWYHPIENDRSQIFFLRRIVHKS